MPAPRGFKNRQNSMEKLNVNIKYGLNSETNSLHGISSKVLPNIPSRNYQGSIITEIQKITPVKTRNYKKNVNTVQLPSIN